MSTVPRIGDVFEIDTPRGVAYIQYSHSKPPFGALIRVLPGTFDHRLSAFAELVKEPTRFFTFFPVSAALKRGILAFVAHESVPEHSKPFPLFKVPAPRDPLTGRIKRWWLWDGEREWPVDDLAPEHRNLSIRSNINDTLLIERIVSGWSPADDR
jgi:hypothetical protein